MSEHRKFNIDGNGEIEIEINNEFIDISYDSDVSDDLAIVAGISLGVVDATKLRDHLTELIDKIKGEAKVKKLLHVFAGVRYWEDATVNGVSDENGNLVPCRNNGFWEPIINVETGVIENWPKGTIANIHYKVCDDGTYILKVSTGAVIKNLNAYVPSCLCPKENGYGDYIIMDINEDGKIDGWKFDEQEFISLESF